MNDTSIHLTDTHTHMFSEEFDQDRREAMERARAAGVTRLLMPNIDSSTLGRLLDTCREYEGFCYPMAGLHPTSVNASFEDELAVVERELKSSEKYIAVGEIGLDYYWDRTFEKEQKECFVRQVQWAVEYDLPVVIHCRDAFEDMVSLLTPYRDTSLRGVFHSFTGTEQEAGKLLEFSNFYIGINGVVTFKNTTLREVLTKIPLKKLLLETDSPYLSPAPNRGKRNESSYIRYVAETLSRVYRVTFEEVCEVTEQNAIKLFSL